MFRNLLHRLADYRRRQRALEELYALDDRSLADIGISRSDIPYLLTRRERSEQASRTCAVSSLRHA